MDSAHKVEAAKTLVEVVAREAIAAAALAKEEMARAVAARGAEAMAREVAPEGARVAQVAAAARRDSQPAAGALAVWAALQGPAAERTSAALAAAP